MSSYKIAFAIVLGGDLVKSTEHLGVSYLTAVLREKGYQVIMKEIEREYDELIDLIKEENIDMLGFTTTAINILQVKEMTEKIKAIFPKLVIAYGGHMATFMDEEILRTINGVDVVIRGEGEETIVELVNALEHNKGFQGIDGISYIGTDGDYIREKNRPLIADLDKLPFPSRDQFETGRKRPQYLRICSSRGCYGNCAYCSSFVGRGNKEIIWRGRSAKNIVDEIEYLVNKYKFHTFDFVDSSFEDPPNGKGKKRIREIANEIINRGLKIYYNCCFRAENWNENDHELLALMVESGLEKINIGFEAGNDRVLSIFNKIARTKDNWKALETIKQHPEIYITFGFIFHHPYATFEDYRDNAEFLYHTGYGQVTRHYFWPLEVYPFTGIKKKLQNDGLLECEDSLYEVYSYQYQNKAVERFSRQITSLVKEPIVSDFEIFDIIIHTYIYRILRDYKNDERVRNEVSRFQLFVDNKRKAIAKANYDFFMGALKLAENNLEYDSYIAEKSKELFGMLTQSKKDILNKQLKLSRELISMGVLLDEL